MRMRVSIQLNEKWFVVPCFDGSATIQWLIEEACRRFNEESSTKFSQTQLEAQLLRGQGLLSKEDQIKEVLNNNEFIVLRRVQQDSKPETKSIDMSNNGFNYEEQKEFIALDGCSLKPEELVRLGRGELLIKLTDEAVSRVTKARNFIEDIVREHKPVYGINTGFGRFANVAIQPENLKILQENVIESHAAGVGNPLPPEKARMLMALRINVLAKGFSGISLKTLNQYIDAFNASCLPWVPEQGTVGASGDLAPMSHLALGLMGEGKMWSPETGFTDAKTVLETHGLQPIELQPKEGLALINGTQLITSLGAEALVRARNVARQADVIAALTLEVLKGTTRAFDKDVHAVRPHKGQNIVARRLRALLNTETQPSEIAESHRFCGRIQDAYTLRCCPQVHGIVNDTIDFVQGIIETEMNSATDNPLVFAERGETISGGNFHGEYPAKALDYLAIGVHELASMSERRTERLVHPAYSELPAFLVKEGGLNSGFMIAHVTAAALVSENKVLCHPSSVDSITTSAGTEDHVSMGGFAARKAVQVVANVERALAIELLCACQGIDLLRPLTTTRPLEEVYKLVRSVVKPWDKDRFMSPDIDATTQLLRDGKVWEVVEPYITSYINCGGESGGHVSHGSPTSSTRDCGEAPHKKLKTDESLVA